MATMDLVDDVDEELAKAIAMSLQTTDTQPEKPSTDKEIAASSVSKEPTQQPPITTQKDNPAAAYQPSPAIPPPAAPSTVFPNLEFMQILLSMGISQNASLRGLYNTGNSSVDLAAAWVFEHLEDPDLHEPFKLPEKVLTESDLMQIALKSDSFKMVFVVNSSLQMGLGKAGAQIGHATLALYKTLLLMPSETGNLNKWEDQGAKKIVVKGRDTAELLRLQALATSKSVVNVVIKDAGLTQIPSGSVTVLALFGNELKVDEITGKLSLL